MRLKLIVLCLFVGCSAVGPYTPNPPRINSSLILRINVSKSVTIINAQPSSVPHDLGFRGIVVNYNESTQVIVDMLENELKNMGAIVNREGDKTLEIAITDVRMILGFTVYRCIVTFRIKTGEGYTETLEATRASQASGINMMAKATKPLNVAISDCVLQILSNKNIQNYLEK